MGNDYFTNPLVFLVQVLFGLYILVVMLRFLLQLFRADFYNPLSQFIVKVTTPVLRPLRRFIPGWGGIDMASLLLAWLLMSVQEFIILALKGLSVNPAFAFAFAVPELVGLVINIFLVSILIQVIISWVNPGSYNPATQLLYSLTEPLLRPARRLIPPVSGFDFSPIVVGVALILLKMLLIEPLERLAYSVA